MSANQKRPHLRVVPSASLLTDDEIVVQACFPLLSRDRVSPADYAFALIIDRVSHETGIPGSLVIWPDGARAIVCIRPGDRAGDARRMLIEVHRAAETGVVGAVPSEVSHG